MSNSAWKDLTPSQVNRCAKDEVERKFVSQGWRVSPAERPHAFTVLTPNGGRFNVVVRSFRVEKKTSYTFMRKTAFNPDPSLLLAVVRFEEGQAPSLYLIPSSVDGQPNPLLENRPYTERHKSTPEWGITLSESKMAVIRNECTFSDTMARL